MINADNWKNLFGFYLNSESTNLQKRTFFYNNNYSAEKRMHSYLRYIEYLWNALQDLQYEPLQWENRLV